MCVSWGKALRTSAGKPSLPYPRRPRCSMLRLAKRTERYDHTQARQKVVVNLIWHLFIQSSEEPCRWLCNHTNDRICLANDLNHANDWTAMPIIGMVLPRNQGTIQMTKQLAATIRQAMSMIGQPCRSLEWSCQYLERPHWWLNIPHQSPEKPFQKMDSYANYWNGLAND